MPDDEARRLYLWQHEAIRPRDDKETTKEELVSLARMLTPYAGMSSVKVWFPSARFIKDARAYSLTRTRGIVLLPPGTWYRYAVCHEIAHLAEDATHGLAFVRRFAELLDLAGIWDKKAVMRSAMAYRLTGNTVGT